VVNQCATVVETPNSCRPARRRTTILSSGPICDPCHPRTKHRAQMAPTNIDGNETFSLPTTQGKPALVTDLTRHDMQTRTWSPAWDNNHLP
jgi:hypothetical protein